MSKKTAIVLCGTVPHALLLEKLKARGYFTVLADWNGKAPAVPYADKFVLVNAFDKEAILDLAQAYDASLVISSCSEQANSVCCYVAEKLGLPHPYSYETSLDVTNKGRMKTIFKKAGVPTSDFELYTSVGELAQCKMEFPLVVKPVDAYSSKGVRKADNYEEMLAYGAEALEISKSGQGIVEGYCSGFEIQVDCVAVKGRATVLMTRSKRTLSQDAIELNSCGSMVPAALSSSELKQVTDIAERICEGFGLCNTPFFYQARVNNGLVSVLEFAPRIGGGLSFQMIKRATGVDVVDVSIASFLNEMDEVETKGSACKNLSTLLLYMTDGGIFGEVSGLGELEKADVIDYAVVLKERGAVIGPEKTSSNRVATLILSADTREELTRKTAFVLEEIDILDANGKSCMVR